MRYLAKRVERICDELYRLRIVQRIPLTDLICKKGMYIRPEAADAAAPPWTSFDSRTMHWYGPGRALLVPHGIHRAESA